MKRQWNELHRKLLFSCLGIGALQVIISGQALSQTPRPRAMLGRTLTIEIVNGIIEPNAVEIPSGTTIVWVNKVGQPVQVRFRERSIDATCKAPRGFEITASGITKSELIADGALASVCILAPSNYPYEIEMPDSRGVERLQGSILVNP